MKIITYFIVCFSLCIAITGCGPRKQDDNTIVFWHWMTDREDAIKELANQYEQETGVKVKVDLYAPSEAYSKKIIASAQAKVLPDVFGILDKKETLSAFIRNGFIADLTEDFSRNDFEWENSLFTKAVNVNKFKEGNTYNIKPGIYGVPLDVTNIQMLYNKKILKKAGIVPPKTFDEFIEALATLQRMGISGFVSGWGELWIVETFAWNYAFNIMGEDKIMATYRGDVPYTDPDWIRVFQVFKDLTDSKALARGIVTKVNKFAEQDFALERAAFSFNGSWCVNVYHKMNPDLEYAPMLPPAVNENLPMRISGGAGTSFVVNNNSSRKDKAIAFLKWLTAKEQQVYLSQETRNLPANREAVDFIPKDLSSFTQGIEFTTHPTLWKYNEMEIVVEKFSRGIQSIIIGDKTPQEVAEAIQKIKEKEMAKAKRRNR
ncbi:MAG: ABC-type glycerol-3-phosphate transport system substrate-binding protein [Candidatus Omnitrophota bacterium]|jgi:ABC-type glycerol-3-phosphate transport system substrate-binding protein